MKIHFREIDPFNTWLWIRFSEVPSQGEKNYIETIFDSWFVLGKLGGFNADNLQSHEESSELSWMQYNEEKASSSLPSLMHNLGHLEYQETWARCWVDLGTCDAICLDVLINALRQIDIDIVKLEEIFIGGINEDWEIEYEPDSIYKDTIK